MVKRIINLTRDNSAIRWIESEGKSSLLALVVKILSPLVLNALFIEALVTFLKNVPTIKMLSGYWIKAQLIFFSYQLR